MLIFKILILFQILKEQETLIFLKNYESYCYRDTIF